MEGGESKKEVPTLGGKKRKRETREKQEAEKKWERKEHRLLRKNDKWTN